MSAPDGNGRTSFAGAFMFIAGVWGLLSIVVAEGLNPGYNVSSDSVSGLGVPYFSHFPVTCTTLPDCAIPVQPASAVIVLSFVVGGVFNLLGGYLMWKATIRRLFGLGVTVLGVLLLVTGASYLPFYLGSPSSGAVDVASGAHGVSSVAAFFVVFVLAAWAFGFVRGPFRYLSPALGAVILASALLLLTGDYLGVGFGGMERILIYSIMIWDFGYGAYLLGGSELSPR